MNKFVSTALAATVAALPSLSFACAKPESIPVIPDPNTAVTAQMIKANNEVKAYVKATEDYLACAGLSRSEEKDAIDALKAYADEFNSAIRVFKSKQG